MSARRRSTPGVKKTAELRPSERDKGAPLLGDCCLRWANKVRRERKKGRRDGKKRIQQCPRAPARGACASPLLRHKEQTDHPLRLGRFSARGERALGSPGSKKGIAFFPPSCCWRPPLLLLARSRSRFFLFFSNFSSSSRPPRKLTAMLATRSAKEERITEELDGERKGIEREKGTEAGRVGNAFSLEKERTKK